MSTSQLTKIPVAHITMISNYRDVEPVSEKDADVIELAESIKKFGLLQSILLRPNKKRSGYYEVIFGHRRFIASKVAGLTDVPATLREVADEDILELQVTENLQRKDPHPLDESIAFKALIDKKKYSVSEIALRFAKDEKFVTQRLKLNDLIPDLQKTFKQKDSMMLIGHAIALARLTKEDQAFFYKRHSKNFGSVADTTDFIDRNIIQNLANVIFDKKDATLFPQAGACVTCMKRSGCSKLLFEDIKSPDRCFDKACFAIKTEKGFVLKLHEIIETKPEVIMLKSGDVISKEVSDILTKQKIKIWDYFSSEINYGSGSGSNKRKAFMITGNERGQIKEVYIKLATKDQKGNKIETPEALAFGIRQRLDRAKELDEGKTHAAIIEAVEKRKELSFVEPVMMPMQSIDRGIMIWLLLNDSSYDRLRYEKGKTIMLPKEPKEKGYNKDYFKELAKVDDITLALIIRNVIRNKFLNKNLQNGVTVTDTPIKIIAEYIGVDTAAIFAAQKEVADKREARANQRIAALKKTATKSPADKKINVPAEIIKEAGKHKKPVTAAKKTTVVPVTKSVKISGPKKALKKSAKK